MSMTWMPDMRTTFGACQKIVADARDVEGHAMTEAIRIVHIGLLSMAFRTSHFEDLKDLDEVILRQGSMQWKP